MRKIISLLLLFTLSICLLCACNSNKANVEQSVVNFTGESTDVLLEVHMEDKKSSVDGGPNVLSAHKWVVRYDGTVSYTYTSGHGSTSKDMENGFNESEIDTIINIIKNQKDGMNETVESSYEYWEIACFSNGEKVKTFGGFIDNDESLIKLTEMLTGIWNTRR